MAPNDASGPAGIPAWLGRSAKPTALDQASAIADTMGEIASIWSARFAELASTPVEMTFRNLRLARVTQVVEERGETAICATIRAPEWNADTGLVLERAVVTLLVEALFGGEGEDDGAAGPVLSPIEKQIAQVFGHQVADAVQAGLAPHLPARLQFDRLLSKPDFGPLSKSDGPVGVLTLMVSALGQGGEFDLLLPLALLDSIAEALSTEIAEAPVEHDPRWSRQLGDEVGRAMTQLRAVIDMPVMSLGTILSLTEGQVLSLPSGAGGKVKLSCGPSDLFRCDLGQLAGHYTLRIEEALGGLPSERNHPLNLATSQ